MSWDALKKTHSENPTHNLLYVFNTGWTDVISSFHKYLRISGMIYADEEAQQENTNKEVTLPLRMGVNIAFMPKKLDPRRAPTSAAMSPKTKFPPRFDRVRDTSSLKPHIRGNE